MLKSYSDIHAYYLHKCRETVAGMKGATALKTDCWNEVRGDIPGTGDIIGALPEVSKWYCVEKMEKRAREAREKFKREDFEIITAQIQDIEFAAESFDAILCLGTLNHMGWLSFMRTMTKFCRWLRPLGGLYLAVWVTDSKSRPEDSANEDERMYHNRDDVEHYLECLPLKDIEREAILNENNPQTLIGYRCRALDEKWKS